jgi:hypothetical protein
MAEGTILEHDLPDAGWYADPENPRLQRYWAGDAWTHHVRHSDGVPVTTQPTFVAEEQVAPSPTNRVETQLSAYPTFSPQTAFPAHTSSAVPLAFSPVLTYSSSIAQPLATVSARDRIAIEEPERAAYIPMSTIHHSVGANSQMWNARSSSPSTASVWIIAITPLIALISQFVALTIAPAAVTQIVSLAVSAAIVVVVIVAAIMDAVTLRRRELPSASPAWLLLTPLVYLGVRLFVLRREGFRYPAPIVVFVLSLLIGSAAGSYLISIW